MRLFMEKYFVFERVFIFVKYKELVILNQRNFFFDCQTSDLKDKREHKITFSITEKAIAIERKKIIQLT